MEYKKDKRTKNLTLRDIHVGDWVQVWSEQAERYSPPLKIIQICDDGTIYLVTSDEERPTPWEEDIKNVDALEITPELLIGFGLEVIKKKDDLLDEFYISYNGQKIFELYEYSHSVYKIETLRNSYEYFNDFAINEYKYIPEIIKLEWKGIER